MAILTAILNTLIVLICLFLICLILIQRGKGGGLAGAFGGVGGSSAFGTKAGDVFTRVTMIVASIWIVLSMILVVLYNQGRQSDWDNDAVAGVSKEVSPKNSREKGKLPRKGTTGSTGGPTVPVSPVGPSGSPLDVPAIPDNPSPARTR
ncbi:MAG: hypothetical protein NVSMB9_15600 [Isosphaeraceae bacterium]